MQKLSRFRLSNFKLKKSLRIVLLFDVLFAPISPIFKSRRISPTPASTEKKTIHIARSARCKTTVKGCHYRVGIFQKIGEAKGIPSRTCSGASPQEFLGAEKTTADRVHSGWRIPGTAPRSAEVFSLTLSVLVGITGKNDRRAIPP